MSFINYSAREINCKIVYYGPGLCGKTTNLQYIYNRTNPEVKGKMMLEPDDNPYAEGRITTMQLRVCTKWIQKDYPERCAVFDKAKWLEKTKDIKRKSMHFCIDRFEYPNIKGQYPVIYISFNEAKQLCDESGKRLCNEDEWTFACEGEEGRPYPYGNGYRRDPKKCITDQKWRPYSETAMIPRDGEAAGNEMDKLWQGKYSGQQKQCRSTFGVYDMTGNIDEWTTSTRKGGLHTILKGGYWGPVRTRCRPSTRSHDQNHTFYQQGFRCCTGIKGKKRRKSGDGKAPASRRALPPQLR